MKQKFEMNTRQKEKLDQITLCRIGSLDILISFNGYYMAYKLTKRFSAVVKTHKRRSNKIYKTKLIEIKI